eukprot:TRINITY_DN1382_c0_g1_i2.p1 TRINITY_DN1382_c0_g1~~TRINITY_DN1382_c0_g1_i2.p1  ORF type:complete len:389 (-),score=47.78 TRINITY_DN1382_c0_g1_i2:110-1276(-)
MKNLSATKIAVGAILVIFILTNFVYMRMMTNYNNLQKQIPQNRFKTRDIPDARPLACKSFDWDEKNLPTATVVVVTHDERASVLYRTVVSILERTTEHLLDQIVVIDDLSDVRVDSEVYILPKTKVIRNKERKGLIHSRVIGAENSHPNSEVIVFLDAHCEVNFKWLEPLLYRIKQDPKNTVWPVIDVIGLYDFKYNPINGSEMTGGMDLGNMNFIYEVIPRDVFKTVKYPLDPIPSPIMPGGLFAIDKKWFTESGVYDLGMGYWGAENLEMSVRLWVCGGRVEMIPCSHVGHIFNDQSTAPDYVTKSGSKNQIRFAEVWADDYKYLWYQNWGINEATIKNAGDVSDRKKFKQDNKCKSFKWYHENVYPYMKMPDNAAKHPELDLWRG